MRLTFHSLDSNDNKVLFRTEGTIKNNKLSFKDESTPGAYVELTLGVPLRFRRYGSVKMDMEFLLNTKTKAYYRNNLGLEFDFEVLAEKIEIENNRIYIEYTMFLLKERLSSHKIWILLH